tara:strand:+ start:179 stop:871 length:693 start_codon:yes stop_codon:yes gene_type:complete
MRLDRFITHHSSVPCRQVQRLLAAGRVRVDDAVVKDSHHVVSVFSKVCLGDRLLSKRRAYHYMLHKPAGVISATRDQNHTTVIDLLAPASCPEPLHLAGRLDRSTTGLVLLTNDGRWSRQLTEPGSRTPKVYMVDTEVKITSETVDCFEEGLHFECEDRTTQPAQLELLTERRARLTIYEGLYHQVKRMFHRVGNRVVRLHRERIGQISLDANLQPGEFRDLTPDELAAC